MMAPWERVCEVSQGPDQELLVSAMTGRYGGGRVVAEDFGAFAALRMVPLGVTLHGVCEFSAHHLSPV
jgi:hypothetical protein